MPSPPDTLLVNAGSGFDHVVKKPEHRDATHFLNESSSGEARFFALPLRVLSIGDSPPAPYFEVAVQPSDWPAQLRNARRSSEGQDAALFSEFWDDFLSYNKSEHPGVTTRSKNSERYITLSSKGGVALVAGAFKKGSARCEIYVNTSNAERNSRIFNYLKSHKGALEGAVGFPLDWDDRDGLKTCCVSVSSQLSMIDNREELIHWISDTAKALSDAFFPRLDELPDE